VAVFPIRVFGDPVLRQRAAEIEEIDAKIVRLSEEMIETMYAAPGVGLAAPQVGIERRIFVYDVGEGPMTVINPEIVESRGEWEYEEGCLSVPDLHWPIVRPKEVHLVGRDVQGDEISIEADELLGRVLQHELDHLDGILLIQHLDKDQRKGAMRVLRSRAFGSSAGSGPGLSGVAGACGVAGVGDKGGSHGSGGSSLDA
jgi:peptide deformylase